MTTNHDSHSQDHSFGLGPSGLFDRRALLKITAAASAAAALGTSAFSSDPAEASTPWNKRLGTLKIGYLPITDASPLLVAHARGIFTKRKINVAQPTLFRSWASIAEAFAAKQVDVVHLLMPLATQLKFEAKQDIKVISWNHTDGSAITVANSISSVADLAGKTVAVPFWYSIHNVILQQVLKKNGLKPVLSGEANAQAKTVKLVVLAPADMPPALAAGQISGYAVAEPFNAVAEVKGIGKVLRFTGDVWRDHACCVTVVRGDLVRNNPLAAQAIVDSIAEAQLWLNANRATAAEVLAPAYLPQPIPAIKKALTDYRNGTYSTAIQHPEWKNERIGFHPYPFPSYTKALIERLRTTRIDDDTSWLFKIDLNKAHNELVATGLAEKAISRLGGAKKFGLAKLTRVETVKP